MSGTDVLLFFMVVCALWASVTSVLIGRYLHRRGENVNILLYRAFFLKHLHRYRVLTQEERGRPGGLFYHFVIPINATLVLLLAWIAIRSGVVR
jgi:hypothetical protein